jgi:hypothetical protein
MGQARSGQRLYQNRVSAGSSSALSFSLSSQNHFPSSLNFRVQWLTLKKRRLCRGEKKDRKSKKEGIQNNHF